MYIWIGYIASAKLYLGADEEAVTWLRRTLEFNRNYGIAHFYLGFALEANRPARQRAGGAIRGGTGAQSSIYHPGPLPRRRAERQSDIPEAARADHPSHAEGRDSRGISESRKRPFALGPNTQGRGSRGLSATRCMGRPQRSSRRAALSPLQNPRPPHEPFRERANSQRTISSAIIRNPRYLSPSRRIEPAPV